MRIIITILFFLPILSYSDNPERIRDLSNHLKDLDPFIGKTFKGIFSNSTSEKPNVDVKHWDRALNGNAVRITHSVNNALAAPDPKPEELTRYIWAEN